MNREECSEFDNENSLRASSFTRAYDRLVSGWIVENREGSGDENGPRVVRINKNESELL